MAVTPGDHLVDTSVLLRITDTKAPLYPRLVTALQKIAEAGVTIHVAPQNLVELWNVATRPLSANGLGLTPAEAALMVRALKSRFTLLGETTALYAEWEHLAETVQVSGKQVHDTRLVAYMVVHGIPNLLTLNPVDFRRFEQIAGIRVVEPEAV